MTHTRRESTERIEEVAGKQRRWLWATVEEATTTGVRPKMEPGREGGSIGSGVAIGHTLLRASSGARWPMMGEEKWWQCWRRRGGKWGEHEHEESMGK